MISELQVSHRDAVICISDATSVDNAEWILPNGATVPAYDSALYVYMNYELDSGLVELKHAGSLLAYNEGVYTCKIPDRNGTLHILHIGYYRGEWSYVKTAMVLIACCLVGRLVCHCMHIVAQLEPSICLVSVPYNTEPQTLSL